MSRDEFIAWIMIGMSIAVMLLISLLLWFWG